MAKTVKESILQVLDAIGASNFLDLCAAQLVYGLDGDDIQAFCDYYGIFPTVVSHGNWRMALFCNREDKRTLENDDYKQMREKLVDDAENSKEVVVTPEEETVLKYAQYGWLSPSGEYYPAEWCEHTLKAEEIAEKIYKVEPEKPRDFLCAKGWVLLHNPSQGIAQVTTLGLREHHLSKRQKEFLYDYYSERHLFEYANQYAEQL